MDSVVTFRPRDRLRSRDQTLPKRKNRQRPPARMEKTRPEGLVGFNVDESFFKRRTCGSPRRARTTPSEDQKSRAGEVLEEERPG